MTLDPAGRVLSWSSVLSGMLGHGSEEIVGRHCSLFFSEVDVEQDQPNRLLQRAMENGIAEHPGECKTKEGKRIRVTLTLTPLLDRRNQENGFILQLRRVEPGTEKESLVGTDAALAASQARFQTLFDHAQVGVLLADAESVYMDANAAICRMLGYSREELIGKHASDIVAESDLPHIDAALREIRNREGHGKEWQFRRKDGSTFAAEVIATLMPDGTLLGMIRDVSDRNIAQDYRERLAAIVESSPDAIIGRDLNGTINSWNYGAERLFEYTSAEMVGGSISRLIPDDRREEEEVILDLLRRGGRIEQFETVRRTKVGRLIDVSIAASPIRDARGNIVGTSKIVRDITVLKEREREISRLSRLYAALSQVNQAIVWSRDREELFSKVCQVLVEFGGFRMAWIGWLDVATRQLVPAAQWGEEDFRIERAIAHAEDQQGEFSPSSAAFRTGRPCISNELFDDPATMNWRLLRQGREPRAFASFPILKNGVPHGTLNVYTEEREFFHEKEIKLLEEAATDLSFALDNFAKDDARRKAEDALREERLFTDTMVESMPGALYFYDSTGKFLRWNRNFATVTEYTSEEIAAMHPLEFFPEEDKALVRHRIGEVFEKGESSVEAAFLSKTGERIPYFFTGRRIDFQGSFCLVGVGIDISERKRAELALRDAELRFHTLFEQAPVGVVVVDPVTGGIVECNSQAASQLGYSSLEFCRLSMHDIEAHETLEETKLHIAQIVREGQDQFETKHRTKGGEIRDVYVSARWLELSGSPAIHCIFLDITERARVEAEREKRHRAEAADRIKSAFLATMSHELRTPLNSIIGFTGILLQGLAGPLNDEQRKQLDMVQASARHLLALVNDVLDISKIEAGQLEVAHETFDTRRSILKVITLVRPQAAARGLSLRIDLADELGEATSDERRFEQILLNLLSNAIKFTDHGEVGLRADLVGDFDPSGPAIRIQVWDTGMGIRGEDLPSLFQPFRQVDSGLSRSHDGTGLGLAICRRLTDLMGGTIDVQSTWGAGSTFTVTLPLRGGGKR